MTKPEIELTEDELFDIFSNRRRRYVLRYLADHPDGMTIQELSRQVAAIEQDIAPEEVSPDQQKRVYVSLYQTHIPKLTEADIVKRTDEGELTLLDKHAGEITYYLHHREDEPRPWHWYYVTAVSISILFFALATLDVSIFGAIEDGLIFAWITFGLALITAAYIGLKADIDAILRRLMD